MDGLPLFRGADISNVLKALEKIEIDSGLFVKSRKKKKVFLSSTSEAIFCNYGKRLIQWRRGLRTAIRRHSFRLVYTPIGDTLSNASSIRVKNNVIAFYPERNLVCKFWLDTGIRKISNLSNEAKAIMIAEQYNFCKVPKIVLDKSSPTADLPPALWFELFQGYSSSKITENKSKTALEFLRILFLWYQANGINFIKTEEAVQVNKRAGVTLRELLSYGWDQKEADLILQANMRIIESRKTLPVSYLHGDASVGNCLANKRGELLVFDWEETQKGCITEDVFTLLRQDGIAVKESYEAWLANIAPDDDHILELDIQLDMVRMWKNLGLHAKRKYLINIMTTDEIDKQIGHVKSQVLASARQICNSI